jgi:hypothetical protein
MPVNMRWGNDEKTLYIAEYVGEWTWEEFYPALEAANRHFDEVDHVVDVIHDWSHSVRFPMDILTHSRNLIKRMHPRTGVNVHVGTNNLFMSMWRIFNKVYNAFTTQKKFLFADTVEEARVLLAEHSQTILS